MPLSDHNGEIPPDRVRGRLGRKAFPAAPTRLTLGSPFPADNATNTGKYRQTEVDPFSSRTNATNTWFSQKVLVRETTPASIDTVACLREFLTKSSNPDLYATEYISQLASSAQPLIYARLQNGLRQKCSVNHISVIIKGAIANAKIESMKPRHLRGASTSKIVALFPDALAIAMGLGRWTTGKTFFQHCNAPVTLLQETDRPDSISMHGQQLLRWGWRPPPPNVTIDEYDSPSS